MTFPDNTATRATLSNGRLAILWIGQKINAAPHFGEPRWRFMPFRMRYLLHCLHSEHLPLQQVAQSLSLQQVGHEVPAA